MKKRIVWLVLVVAALVMILTLSGCVKENGENKVQNNDGLSQVVIFEESDNSFSLKAEIPQTEVIEKEITITHYQSGTIKIKKNVSSGNLHVSIMNREYLDSLNSSLIQDEEVINISKGAGTYQIRFDLRDFVGSCDVSWEIKNEYSEEYFASAQGFGLRYIPEKFSYTNENGRETFTLRSDSQSDAELYFSVYTVDAAGKDAEKTRLKEGATASSDSVFDNGALLGEYARFPQDNGTEIINFMFDLKDGRLLVIETLQFDEMYGEASDNEYIKGLISSFSYEQ